MNKIYYDITEFFKYDKKTGIQRVTRSLLNELHKKNIIDYEIVLVYGDIKKNKYFLIDSSPDFSNFKLSNIIISPTKNDIFISVDLTYNITEGLIKELYHYKNNGTYIFFVVYDLIPIRYPEWFRGTNEWFEGNDYLALFNFWFTNVVNVSNGLICISNTVKNDVTKWLEENNINNNIILDFFHLGADIKSSLPSIGKPFDNKILIELEGKTTFLVVGTIEPRKGHKVILNAFNELWKNNLDANLVFVGKEGWKVKTLIKDIKEHTMLNENLFWLDGVSDEYLESVYSHSSVLLLLSKDEGFGLPLIEAASKNIPIIANDITIFREVCGKNAYYINLENDNIEDKLSKWIDLFHKNIHPKSNNINVLTWEESTNQFLKCIEKIIGKIT